MEQHKCKYCQATGNERCAFIGGLFSGNNFNCGLMSKLRLIATIKEPLVNNEQSASLIAIPDTDKFVVLSWYKNRDCTETAIVVNADGDVPSYLSLEVAYQIVEANNV